jgi:hypothetical protein
MILNSQCGFCYAFLVFATAICRPRQKDGRWQSGTDLGSKVRTGIAV